MYIILFQKKIMVLTIGIMHLPLCQNCHNQFGDNPSKRKEIKQMRDWWYEKSEKIFSKQDPEVLNDINSKLEKIHNGDKESFAELKEILKNYLNQTIDMISTDRVSDSTTVIVNSAVPSNTSNPYIGELIDVNNDGKKELVVDYHAGAYAVNMKVFGWDEYGEFKRTRFVLCYNKPIY